MSRHNSIKGATAALPHVALPLLSDDRRSRQEWIQNQLEDRRRRRDREQLEKQSELEEHHERLWRPFVREAARSHELNIAWKQAKGFFSWDRVLALDELEGLRVTGFSFQSLPSELASSLHSLTVLSLIACQLESLPENIGELASLTELDLTKNNLRRLPESLSSLVSLRQLNLSSNVLEELPNDFGKLVLLDKLWVENNRLTTLPPSIALSRAHSANFSNNRLQSLPEAIGDMPNLVHLNVNLNQLIEFPDALTRLTQLQSLHASRNKLVTLPRNVGNLASLKDLRLDWNQITELPFSFRLLRSLEILCMERNPLKLPPLEYISKGVPATMLYIERSLEEFVRKARRQAVEKLQDVLAFAMKFVDEQHKKTGGETSDELAEGDLEALDSLFEPRVERAAGQNETLPFFAVVWDSFFDVILPIIDRRSNGFFQLQEFCSRDELEDALQHYNDFFGAASRKDSAVRFRRCACIDELEWKHNGVKKRKVCVPGQAPYMCERAALLVRMTMMTQEEAKDQLASTYLRRKIERLVAKTKRKCVDFINSEDGVGHFEKLALAMAKRHCLRRKRVKKLRLQHAKQKLGLEKKIQKLRAKMEAFRKVRDARRKGLEEKLGGLKKEQAALGEDVKNAKKAKRLGEKIREIEDEIEKEPIEDKKILEVELAMEAIESAGEKANVAFEKAKAAEMNDGDLESTDEGEEEGSEEEAESEEDSGDDGDSEIDDEEDNATKTDEDSVSNHPETLSDDGGEARSFFNIEMPDLHVEPYRRVASRAIENSLGDDRVVNEEELLVLYQQHLRDAYVAEKCALVEKKATYEFLQMRVVLKRWMGHGTRAVFEGWRDVVKENRANAALTKKKQVRKQQIEAQNKALAEELARVEARKWVHRVDMYTDAVYYEHSETGETSWTPPIYWEEEQQRLAVPPLRLPPL